MDRFDNGISHSVNSNISNSVNVSGVGIIPSNIMASADMSNNYANDLNNVTTPNNIVDLTVDASSLVAKNLANDFNKVTSAITFIKELPEVDRRDMVDSQTASE